MTYLPPKACSRSKLGSIDHPSLPAKKTAMVSFVARQLHCGPYCSSRLNMAFFATTFSSTATGAAKAFRSLRMRNVQLTPAPGLSRCRSRQYQIVAAWGDDIEWGPAKVVKSYEAAKGQQTLVVEVGEEAVQKYERPGQYLQLRLQGSKPGFFAIASAPSKSVDGTVELLVRRKGETAELLCNSAEGTEVEASPIGGRGFSVEKAGPDAASHVFIFATGSGISPIKALIESGALQADKRKSVRLFYGTHDPESTAYREAFADWEAAGVQIMSVFSADGKGYVQDVFEKENEISEGSSVAVILCGHKEMCQAITKQMQDVGVATERILTNF